VFAGGVVSNVVGVNLDQACVYGTPGHAFRKRADEHVGEEGEDVETHRGGHGKRITLFKVAHVGFISLITYM
jgi:hypothetical protein